MLLNCVSIPFKRESVSKAIIGDATEDEPDVVSIPFKRESVSKEESLPDK